MVQRYSRRQAVAAAAALFGLPEPSKGAAALPQLPDEKLFERDRNAYWARVRKEQFLLPEWRAFLNTGSLGVAARPVLAAIADYLNRAASLDFEDMQLPYWGGIPLDEMRTEMAEFFGCKKDELALTHNTTEGMSMIANGLDLRPGDEVLLTDQEHPGGTNCWLLKQARSGIRVREAKIPIPPRDPGQVADAVVSAIGPQTRVVSFSGVTTRTGLVLPVREICGAARAKGVLTVVDGAHMNGQLPVSFHGLGCDFLAGSPHKWMMAPAGCGVLFIREEMQDRLWVSIASGGWDDKSLKAQRFQMVGTNNRGIFEGYLAALRFLKRLGPERVYGRIHELAKTVRHRALRVPKLQMLTPDDDRMYAGLVTFEIPGLGKSPFWELAKRRRIWVVGSDRIRISTHIHTRPRDIDVFFETLDEGLRA